MSNGPISGDGIAITLPPGKVVFWSALVQAAYDQFVQLKDSNGNVVFTAQGPSASGYEPTQIGQGFFQVPAGTGAYTVYLGTNGGSAWSSVIWDQDQIDTGGTTYLGRFLFGTEDAGDNDYNDTFFQMQWFEYIG